MLYYRISCAVLMLLSSWSVAAASVDVLPNARLSEQDFIGDLPVVLSVSRLAQPLSEAPGAVTVINAETIRLSGARQLADIFRLVPGFQVGHMGSSTRVYYHGALEQFGQHMQVLIDGRSIYSPYYVGGINWNSIPLALQDIERIEVLRGSNSAAFGSDAFLGVANIITKDPSETRGWLFSQTMGNSGIRDTLLRYGDRSENLSWRASFGRTSDQGFKDTPSLSDERFFNIRADWQLNLLDKLQIQLGGNNTGIEKGYNNEIGCATPPCHPGDVPRPSYLTSNFASFKWQRVFSADEEFQVHYHHSEERLVDRFLYGNPLYPPTIIDFGGYAYRDDLEAQHIFSPRDDMRLVWGAQARRDSVRSVPLFLSADSLGMTLTRLFGNWEWRVSSQAILNIGASAENSSMTGFSVAPRVMMNYHLTPEQTLRLGMSKATRAPSIFEQKANMVVAGQVLYRASGNFRNESVISRELGYLGDFRAQGVVLDVRAFHESINGLGQVEGTDYFNRDHPDIYGVEWTVEYKPSASTRFTLNQSFAHVNSKYTPAPGDDPVNKNILPTHSGSLGFFQKIQPDLDFSLLLYSVGAMRWAGQPEPKVIPAYRRIDARLAKPFVLSGVRGELALTVQNLGGRYLETDSYFPFERRVMLTTTLQY